MSKEKSVVSRQVSLSHPYQDYFEKLWSMTPSYFSPMFSPFKSWMDPEKTLRSHTIYVDVGRDYSPEDIHTSVEDGKLKICGKTQKKDEHGVASHEFNKEYDLPKNVEVDSMKTELDHYGGLRIHFKRKLEEHSTTNIIKCLEPECEDLSTEKEYHIKIWVPGYDPKDLSISTKGRELVIEGKRKKEESSEDGLSHYCECGSYKRSIYLGDDIEEDTVKAKFTTDGSVEVMAKKDPKKLKHTEKKLKIEVPK
ncbi:hypothetical protein MXB_3806 [Myxobolus squamalis]|nr:hypothetical protein MXB_3806 [Myxobolus squamalis]